MTAYGYLKLKLFGGYTTREMLTLLILCGKTSYITLNIKIQRRAMRCIIQGSQRNSNAYKEYYAVATGATPGKQAAKASKAKSLSALSEVAMTEAQQRKLVTKRSLQQTHISQASGSGADERTDTLIGVPDVPTDESEEEISWN
nr:hypothetical protein [Tanacetum cinerariifolium]